MSTDWLTVRVPPSFGLAAAGACYAVGAAVGWTTAWVGIGRSVGLTSAAGLAGALVAAGAVAGWEQAAKADAPTAAASPSAARPRNWRRVSTRVV